MVAACARSEPTARPGVLATASAAVGNGAPARSAAEISSSARGRPAPPRGADAPRPTEPAWVAAAMKSPMTVATMAPAASRRTVNASAAATAPATIGSVGLAVARRARTDLRTGVNRAAAAAEPGPGAATNATATRIKLSVMSAPPPRHLNATKWRMGGGVRGGQS
jgi:hypothetical protein